MRGSVVVIIKVFGAKEKFELDAEGECAVHDGARGYGEDFGFDPRTKIDKFVDF